MILSYFRTIVLYLVLIGVVRLMGKRQIGEMEPAEFVVTMLVANLAAIPMQDAGIPLLTGLIPILTVLGVELVLSWLMLCSGPLRRLFCGKPVLLIDNGRLLQGNLRMTRVTLDELFGKLREKDILDITQVQYAILETDGNLSVQLDAGGTAIANEIISANASSTNSANLSKTILFDATADGTTISLYNTSGESVNLTGANITAMRIV